MQFSRQRFPGKFSFREEAMIYSKEFSFGVDVDVSIDFYDRINVSVRVFKTTSRKEVSEGTYETLGFLMNPSLAHETKIIIPRKFIFFGFLTSSRSSLDRSRNRREESDFRVYKVISLEFPGYMTFEDEGAKHYLFEQNLRIARYARLKVYLSDEFSFQDRYVISEGIESINLESRQHKFNNEVFCNLSSGYLFRCGKSHKSYFSEQNLSIDQTITHKFSFFDVSIEIPIKEPLREKQERSQEESKALPELTDLLDQLEITSLRACDYLSILVGRIIEPIYYEYEASSSDGFISGIMIPVHEEIRLNTNRWPISGFKDLSLSLALEAFLECCPIGDKIGRSLFNLKSSLSKDCSLDLQVLAIFSSIEYCFSHWFWDMSGYEFLMNHKAIKQKSKKAIESSYKKDKTPALSICLSFFLENLGVFYEEKECLSLFEFRHKIIHGGLFSESTEFLSAIAVGRDLAVSILNSILRIISKSCNMDIYDQIKACPLASSYLNNAHWRDVESARQELVDFESPSAIFRKYWPI